jgi:phytoene desaturase
VDSRKTEIAIVKKRVVIIGGGIGGLATANILAKQDYEVELYEARGQLGGRAGVFEAKGFRFDTGPSWYLMPRVFEHYYELLGEDIDEHIKLTRLDPAYQVFFEDDVKPAVIKSSLESNQELFEKMETGAGVKLKNYLEESSKTYDLAQKYFLYNTFQAKHNVLTPEVLKSLSQFLGLAMRPLHSYVKKHFTTAELQQILEYPAVFLGASPFNAPAIFSLMSYLDMQEGVFYPEGGLYRIIESLVSIGKKLGVSYHLKSPVISIATDGRRATGIQLKSGKPVQADIVISNADLHFTETELLPKELQTYPEKYWEKKLTGPSALLLYLGVKGTIAQLKHHNLFFTKDWHQNFTEIFQDRTYPTPASLYVCKPSATDKTVAPKATENVFVLVPWPANGSKQPKDLEIYADEYLAQIEDMAGIPDLHERIVYQKIFSPADFANEFNSWNGTALGPAHTLRQSALFRPANRSKKVSNLYYVGAGTQPGIGLPMCLISAELVYKYLTNDRSAGPLPVPLKDPHA